MPILLNATLSIHSGTNRRTLDLLLEWIRRFSYKDFTDNGDTTLFKVRGPNLSCAIASCRDNLMHCLQQKLTKFIKSLPSEDANQFKLLFMRKVCLFVSLYPRSHLVFNTDKFFWCLQKDDTPIAKAKEADTGYPFATRSVPNAQCLTSSLPVHPPRR